MSMSMYEYVKNPGGKNAVYSFKDMYRDLYEKKYGQVMTREAGKLKYFLYTDSANDRYIIHLKIPSEVLEKFYYDVVLEFTPKGGIFGFNRDLFYYNMRAFSNDPRFTYVFAYAFKEHDMFFTDLQSRTIPECLKIKPVRVNPGEDIGYVKSIYFAYIFMRDHHLNEKTEWNSAVTYHKNDFVGAIRLAEDVIYQRTRDAYRLAHNITGENKAKERKKKLSFSKSRKAKADAGVKQLGAVSNVVRRKGAGAITRIANKTRRARATGKGQNVGNVRTAKVAKVSKTTKRK